MSTENLTPTQQQIKQAYEKWLLAVSTAKGNPDSVVALYDADAIVLPTLSGKIHYNDKHCENNLEKYFRRLTSIDGLTAITSELHIKVIGDIAIANGLYNFNYKDEDDADQVIPARFTFVYQKNQNGQWLIINHHSSTLPD
ncbi:MAG: nuclear transport factor 2 family protein [Pseudomonadota bacterium]